MIVSCPACSARYKISESKMRGRGAKITCPRCGHRFVVYRDHAPARPPEHVSTLDFSAVGVTWRVRRGGAVAYQLYDLKALRDLLDQGLVDRRDDLSFNGRAWTRLDDIANLDMHFWEVYQRARGGEIAQAPGSEAEYRSLEEEDADAPTMIVPGSRGKPTSRRDLRQPERDEPGVLLFEDEDQIETPAARPRRPGHYAEPPSDGESVSDDATVMRPGPPAAAVRQQQTMKLLGATYGRRAAIRAAATAAAARPGRAPVRVAERARARGRGFAAVLAMGFALALAVYGLESAGAPRATSPTSRC
ncbi:MAG: zinc-ribbon domain-containing protein [Myxococcota bacterium]